MSKNVILQKKKKKTAPILQGLSGLRRVETNSRVPGVWGKDRELLHVGGQAREDVVRGGGGVGRVPTEVGIGHESSQGSTE